MVQPPQPYPHSVHCLFEHEGEIAKGMAVPWPQSPLVYGTAILTHQELTTLGNLDAHYLVLHRSATPTHHMADSLRRYSHGIVSSRLFASASAPKTFQKKAWGLRMGGLKGPPPQKAIVNAAHVDPFTTHSHHRTLRGTQGRCCSGRNIKSACRFPGPKM